MSNATRLADHREFMEKLNRAGEEHARLCAELDRKLKSCLYLVERLVERARGDCDE